MFCIKDVDFFSTLGKYLRGNKQAMLLMNLHEFLKGIC